MFTGRSWRCMSCVAAIMMLCGSLAMAQAVPAQEAPSVVSGVGVATVKKRPDTMRMTVSLVISGKDLKEALTNLKARQDTLRTQLAGLGATDKSIRFSAATIGVSKNPQQRQMEMMVRQRMRAMGKTAKAAEEPKTTQVSSVLTADWPIKAEDPNQLLLAADELQGKIKAIKFADSPDADAKPAAESEEEAEEMAGMMMSSEVGQSKPGEAVYMFVGRISDEERAKAAAEAFQKAKTAAARSAAAAGATLGKLHHLTSQYTPTVGDFEGFNPWQNPVLRAMMQGQMGGGEPDEIMSPKADEISVLTTLNASFLLVGK